MHSVLPMGEGESERRPQTLNHLRPHCGKVTSFWRGKAQENKEHEASAVSQHLVKENPRRQYPRCLSDADRRTTRPAMPSYQKMSNSKGIWLTGINDQQPPKKEIGTCRSGKGAPFLSLFTNSHNRALGLSAFVGRLDLQCDAGSFGEGLVDAAVAFGGAFCGRRSRQSVN